MLGPVFRGYDPDQNRVVAIKACFLDVTPEQAADLAVEFDRLPALKIPHAFIISPFAGGSEGSIAFLVQEYFVADSADVALKQYGPPPVPDALRLIGQLAGALDAAAEVGLHHGALHLRDVLVAPKEMRLTGLGVVPALERVGYRPPPRRPYAAPERMTGQPVTRASDVFSLACLSFELLTGRRPLPSGDIVTVDTSGIQAADAQALSEVFARVLSPSPEDRHPSALEFAAALKHALTGAPLQVGAEVEPPKPRRAPRARKVAVLPFDEEPPALPSEPAPAAMAIEETPVGAPPTEPMPVAMVVEEPPADVPPAGPAPIALTVEEPPPDAPMEMPALSVEEPAEQLTEPIEIPLDEPGPVAVSAAAVVAEIEPDAAVTDSIVVVAPEPLTEADPFELPIAEPAAPDVGRGRFAPIEVRDPQASRRAAGAASGGVRRGVRGGARGRTDVGRVRAIDVRGWRVGGTDVLRVRARGTSGTRRQGTHETSRFADGHAGDWPRRGIRPRLPGCAPRRARARRRTGRRPSRFGPWRGTPFAGIPAARHGDGRAPTRGGASGSRQSGAGHARGGIQAIRRARLRRRARRRQDAADAARRQAGFAQGQARTRRVSPVGVHRADRRRAATEDRGVARAAPWRIGAWDR